MTAYFSVPWKISKTFLACNVQLFVFLISTKLKVSSDYQGKVLVQLLSALFLLFTFVCNYAIIMEK